MSLNQQLAIALLLVLVVVGTVTAFTSRFAVERYFQEANQSLNENIAMYVVNRLPLMSETGEVNRDALMALADQAMTVNPSVEVFLLDPDGRIIGHALDDADVVRRSVGLGPIVEFINGTARYPLLADDPRDSERQKAFSAFPIEHDDGRTGYLYVVLGGQQFESVIDMFQGSYVLRIAGGAVLATLIAGLVVGAFVFRRVTAPLVELNDTIVRFASSDLTRAPAMAPVRRQSKEAAALRGAFTRLVETLIHQFEQLKENDRLRRELVANVSHDLRTPLASMQGYIETLLIKEKTLSESERREYLGVAHRHTKQLNRLVLELFELAKYDAGTIEPQLEAFSLAELLQDLVQEFQLLAAERQVELVLAAPARDVWVNGDIGLIQRACENLVQNALRYTPAGGTVTVRIQPFEATTRIEVEDTGRGIPENELPNIFDRYYRNTDDEGSSTGLGLAIVKRIVDLHQSRIKVVSEVQRGTTFSFELANAA